MKGKEKDWDAPAKGGSRENDPLIDRYKAETGRQDIILIYSPKPISMPYHWTGEFSLRCLQTSGAPCCEEFGSPNESNASYVLHVASREGKGEWEKVCQPKNWGYGEDKRLQINSILRDFCEGDEKKFRKTFISITCSDSKKQKLNLMPIKPPKSLKGADLKAGLASMKENAKEFEKFITVDEEDIMGSLNRATGNDTEFKKPNGASEPADADADAEPEPAGEVDLDSELDSFIENL